MSEGTLVTWWPYVRLGQVALSLFCIAIGLWAPGRQTRTLVPLGVMGLISGAIYFMGGSVSLWILIPAASASFAAAVAWWVRLGREDRRLPPRSDVTSLPRDQTAGWWGRLSPVYRFSLLVLAGDLTVVCILLVVLPSPVPALIAFVVLSLSSLYFIRTLPRQAR